MPRLTGTGAVRDLALGQAALQRAVVCSISDAGRGRSGISALIAGLGRVAAAPIAKPTELKNSRAVSALK